MKIAYKSQSYGSLNKAISTSPYGDEDMAF